jgi:hypothetical protein
MNKSNNNCNIDIQGSYDFKEIKLLVKKEKLNCLNSFFIKVSKVYPRITKKLYPFNIEVKLKTIPDPKYFLLVFKQTIIITN